MNRRSFLAVLLAAVGAHRHRTARSSAPDEWYADVNVLTEWTEPGWTRYGALASAVSRGEVVVRDYEDTLVANRPSPDRVDQCRLTS